MTEPSQNVTEGLRKKLLEDQERRARQERRLSFSKKMRILDQMMRDASKLGLPNDAIKE
jgi:hypothetical protein